MLCFFPFSFPTIIKTLCIINMYMLNCLLAHFSIKILSKRRYVGRLFGIDTCANFRCFFLLRRGRPSIYRFRQYKIRHSSQLKKSVRKWHADKLKESIGKGTTKSGENSRRKDSCLLCLVDIIWRDPKRDLAVDQPNMRVASWPCILTATVHPCTSLAAHATL
jgi:hypothetical protein